MGYGRTSYRDWAKTGEEWKTLRGRARMGSEALGEEEMLIPKSVSFSGLRLEPCCSRSTLPVSRCDSDTRRSFLPVSILRLRAMLS